jgi:hypothetical protein
MVFRNSALPCLLGGAALAAVAASAASAAEDTGWSAPDFSTSVVSWEGPNGREFLPVDGSPPAVTTDPAHPYINNAISRVTGEQPTFHISDLTNPNLMQWAKDIMQQDNEEVLAGKIAYMPSMACKHWGIPAVMQSGGPFLFYQTRDEVLIVEEGERLMRHIYLNVPHSENPKPSYYGESVGHYEGDTLVVDTIGFNTETYIDFFRTPHTERMHVTERWRLIDDGEGIEVLFTVDDPGTFYKPWQVMRRLERSDTILGENICRENNFRVFDYGIPIDETPDF